MEFCYGLLNVELYSLYFTTVFNLQRNLTVKKDLRHVTIQVILFLS